MNERLRSALVLTLTLAAGLTKAPTARAQTPDRIHVRLSGDGFTDSILADYLGGLASSTTVETIDVGTTRDPTLNPLTLHLSNINLRRIQVDSALGQWRQAVNNGASYRRNVVLEFVTPAGQALARFRLTAAWPSSYSIAGSLAPVVPGAVPKTVSVEAITIVFEGYVRE